MKKARMRERCRRLVGLSATARRLGVVSHPQQLTAVTAVVSNVQKNGIRNSENLFRLNFLILISAFRFSIFRAAFFILHR